MKLALMGDLHYAVNLFGCKEAEAARDVFYEAYLSAFLAIDADYHLSLGDLTHGGEPDEFTTLYAYIRNYEPKRRFLQVLGNHDTYALTKREIEALTGAPRYQWIDSPGMTLLLLDTARECDPANWGGTLDEEQLAWLEEILPREGNKPVLVFAHHPIRGTTARSEEEMMALDAPSSHRLGRLLASFPGAGFYWNGHNHVQSLIRQHNWHYLQTASVLDMPVIWTATLSEGSLIVAQVSVPWPSTLDDTLAHQTDIICRNMDDYEKHPMAAGQDSSSIWTADRMHVSFPVKAEKREAGRA